MSINVEFCSGCIIRASDDSTLSTLEIKNNFKKELSDFLSQELPEKSVCIDSVSCMKYCPENRVSLIVNNKMTMAKGTSVQAVGEQIKKELK